MIGSGSAQKSSLHRVSCRGILGSFVADIEASRIIFAEGRRDAAGSLRAMAAQKMCA